MASLHECSVYCRVCRKHYTERGNRRPKLLPCCHTVCFTCLKRLDVNPTSGTLRCPVCDQEHVVPRNSVPPNVYMRRILRQEKQILRQKQQILRQEKHTMRQEEQILRQEEQILRQEEQILRQEEHIRTLEELVEHLRGQKGKLQEQAKKIQVQQRIIRRQQRKMHKKDLKIQKRREFFEIEVAAKKIQKTQEQFLEEEMAAKIRKEQARKVRVVKLEDLMWRQEEKKETRKEKRTRQRQRQEDWFCSRPRTTKAGKRTKRGDRFRDYDLEFSDACETENLSRSACKQKQRRTSSCPR